MDNRSDGSVGFRSPAGAKTSDHLAMDHRWTQVTLTDIIGWTDIGPVQEDEQAVPVIGIPFQEPFFIRGFPRALEQPVADPFQSLDLRLESWWRQSISLVVQMHRCTEEGLHGFRPECARILVHHRLQVA